MDKANSDFLTQVDIIVSKDQSNSYPRISRCATYLFYMCIFIIYIDP